MNMIDFIQSAVHSVLSLMLWWSVASVLAGAIFSLIRISDNSAHDEERLEQLALPTQG